MQKLNFIFINISCIYLFLMGCDKTVTPEPEEPEPFLNTIVLDTHPKGFTVFINGKVTGAVTPDSLRSIDTGLVTIKLSKLLYRDTVFTMNVENNKDYNLYFDFHSNPLMLGNIQVNSTPPGANIYLNNDSTEFLTPHLFTKLIPGNYYINLKKDSYWDFSYPLTVQSNSTPVINATLEDTSVWVVYNEKRLNKKINYLTSIKMDANGHIWIGSVEGGLFKFNGNEWINYNIENSQLPDNSITDISVEGNKIWIASFAGLTVLENEQFINYNKINSPLPSDFVIKIFVHNNIKYIYTYANGVTVYNDYEWETFNTNNSGLSSNFITTICADKENNIWFGTKNSGIIKYDGLNWTHYNLQWINLEISNSILALSNNENNHLYIAVDYPGATQIGFQGLLIMDGVNNNFFKGNPQGIIRNIVFDKHNKGWFASSFGVYKESININNYIHFNILNSKLPGNDIRDLTIDQQGNKWFATFGSGVVKYKGD